MNIFAIIMLIGFMTISLIPTFKSRIIYIKSRDIFVFVIYMPNFTFRNKMPVYIEFCLPYDRISYTHCITISGSVNGSV